jgi:hypothetical protein
MNTPATPKRPRHNLSTLSAVDLSPEHVALLEACKPACGGSNLWRSRKLAEAHELLALAQISRRLVILHLDLSVDLRVDLLMKVKVAFRPNPAGPIEVADLARLGVIYREEAVETPQPGFSFIQILAPRPVFNPIVSPDPLQVLCLGQLPAGVPCKEVILITYSALCMTSLQIDLGEPAGLLNAAAAEYFQRNPQLLPLSREPFLLQEGVSA